MKNIVFAILFVVITSVTCQSMPTEVTAGDTQTCWTAPITNMDGSILTDGAGYYLYFAPTSDGQSDLQRYQVTDWSQTCVAFADMTTMTAADIYLKVTAYDTSNNESGWSNQAIRTIGNARDIPGSPSGNMSE